MIISPLIFQPILKPKVWGGRRLAALGKSLPADELIGESWECADLPSAQSIVTRGTQRGKSLHELVETWGPKLTGSASLAQGRFPLLIKFLDVEEPLSVQVHPDELTCQKQGLNMPPKHESWYVIEADENAIVYRGLAEGVTFHDMAERLQAEPRSILQSLRRIMPHGGESYYLPAGTLHAAAGGLLIAEVQTPCDITYRLYDWERSRPEADAGLHVSQALACIKPDVDYSAFERRSHVTSIFTTVTRLINCPSFRIEKVRFVEGMEQDIPYAELVCWIVLSGNGEIRYARNQSESFSAGEVVIIPAGIEQPRLKTITNCVWLEVTIPIESDLSAFPHPTAADLHASPSSKLISVGLDQLRAPHP